VSRRWQRRRSSQCSNRYRIVKLIARAQHWWKIISEGKIDIAIIANLEGVTGCYVTLRPAWSTPLLMVALAQASMPRPS
jgi:hypothetical protein